VLPLEAREPIGLGYQAIPAHGQLANFLSTLERGPLLARADRQDAGAPSLILQGFHRRRLSLRAEAKRARTTPLINQQTPGSWRRIDRPQCPLWGQRTSRSAR